MDVGIHFITWGWGETCQSFIAKYKLSFQVFMKRSESETRINSRFLVCATGLWCLLREGKLGDQYLWVWNKGYL